MIRAGKSSGCLPVIDTSLSNSKGLGSTLLSRWHNNADLHSSPDRSDPNLLTDLDRDTRALIVKNLLVDTLSLVSQQFRIEKQLRQFPICIRTCVGLTWHQKVSECAAALCTCTIELNESVTRPLPLSRRKASLLHMFEKHCYNNIAYRRAQLLSRDMLSRDLSIDSSRSANTFFNTNSGFGAWFMSLILRIF